MGIAIPFGVKEISERLGKYVKDRRLGCGGMGEVWRAWDTELERWVALKFLRNFEDEDRVRFRREAQTAARLTHPGICAVYESGETYIAMQYIDGETLDSVTDLREAAELVRQAALAVDYAHGRGIIHRDLKPANIMKHGRRAIVMDFGLAKHLAVPSDVSVSGTVVGTPCYMSPEQARGEEVGPASDVYALGATLYALVARRPPFQGDSPYEVIRQVVDETPRRLSCEADLATIVHKCLQKDPALRYRTARDLAADLKRWLERKPILARGPSPAYRAAKFLARHAGASAAIAGALLVAVALGALLLHRRAGEIHRRFERAVSLENQREPEQARDAYLRVLDLDADHAPAREGADRMERRLREIQRHLEAARLAVESAGRHFYQADFRREELLRRTGIARVAIGKALELHPRCAPAILLLAQALLHEGREDEAEAHLRAVLEIDPEMSPARLLLGRMLLERGFVASIGLSGREQVILVEAAREISKATPRGGLESDLAQAYIEFSLRRSDALAARIRRALVEYEGHDGVEEFHWLHGLQLRDREALDAFDRALSKRPRHVMALFARALLRASGKDYTGAVEDYTLALEIRPDFVHAILNRGSAYLDLGDLEAALRDTEAVLSHPRAETWLRAYAHNNRASYYRRTGDLARGEADSQEAVRLLPRDLTLLSTRARILLMLGRRAEAREVIDRALSIRIDARLLAFSAELFVLDGHPARALAEAERCIAAWPESGDAHMFRALALWQLDRRDEAMRAIERSIEIRESAEARALAGAIYGQCRRFAESLAHLDTALRLDAKHKSALLNRGITLLHLCRYADAERDFTRVLEETPDDIEALYNRGIARFHLERKSEAFADWRRILPRLPEGSDRRRIVEERLAAGAPQ